MRVKIKITKLDDDYYSFHYYSFKAFEMFHLVPREDNNMINHYFANSKSCFSKA